MDNVIQLDERRTAKHTGREIVAHDVASPSRFARDALIGVALSIPNTSPGDASRWTDWVLTELWVRGHKVVRLDPEDEQP